MFQFGIGGLFAVPNGGNLATPSGPVRFGTIQDVSVEFDQKLVELMGQNKGPDDVAPSDMKITGKGGFAQIEVNIYNEVFFGDVVSTGSNQVQQDEAVTIAAHSISTAWAMTTAYILGEVITDGTNYQICIVPGTSGGTTPTWGTTPGAITTDGSTVKWEFVGLPANFVNAYVGLNAPGLEDLGVKYANTALGWQLQPLTAPGVPAAGQYIYAAGVYGFATADIGKQVLISYEYATPVAASNQGKTLSVVNHLQGYGPTFELFLTMPYMGNNCLHLRKCRSSKTSSPLKRDGYIISDFEFQSYPDASGAWFDWYQLGS